MSTFRTASIAVLLVGAAATAAHAQTTRRTSSDPRPTSQRNYSDRYGVLEQRNIFIRDRTKPTTRRSTTGPGGSASTQPARNPEQMLFVTGIVLEDDGVHAYVEDSSVSPPKILRVAPGENLGRGRVMDIQIDALAFEHAGNTRWVTVGSDLTGQPAGVGAILGSAGDGEAATTAPSAANLDPNDPNLTVEQRMRLRSLQQRQGR
jgi:hypothetical protein